MSEICEKCKGKKRMYYGLWCPKCDKPQIETKKSLNLIKALYHLEALGHTGLKDKVWPALCNCFNFTNDGSFTFYLDSFDDEEELSEDGKKIEVLRKLIVETWNLEEEEDSIEFEVSW